MSETKIIKKVEALTERPVPSILSEQLNVFSYESVHSKELFPFDPTEATNRLTELEGKRALAADFGGDKGTSRLYEIKDSRLTVLSDYFDDVQGDNGQGYIESLESAAVFAKANNLPIGISWGSPMDGSKPIPGPKAKVFMDALAEKYAGDFRNLAPDNMHAVLNDGPAGLIRGAVEANRQFGATNVLFVINGGGIGMSVLKDGKVYASEPGHVEGVAALNNYDQHEECGVFGAKFTCLEQLGANKAGIETQWQKRTGSYMRAKDIEDQYKAGDGFAAELYDHSALVIAHVILGAAKAFGIELHDEQTAVVCHGGAFKFPHYGDRIKQILSASTGGAPNMLLAKDFVQEDSNTCIEGAALMALLN